MRGKTKSRQHKTRQHNTTQHSTFPFHGPRPLRHTLQQPPEESLCKTNYMPWTVRSTRHNTRDETKTSKTKKEERKRPKPRLRQRQSHTTHTKPTPPLPLPLPPSLSLPLPIPRTWPLWLAMPTLAPYCKSKVTVVREGKDRE